MAHAAKSGNQSLQEATHDPHYSVPVFPYDYDSEDDEEQEAEIAFNVELPALKKPETKGEI